MTEIFEVTLSSGERFHMRADLDVQTSPIEVSFADMNGLDEHHWQLTSFSAVTVNCNETRAARLAWAEFADDSDDEVADVQSAQNC